MMKTVASLFAFYHLSTAQPATAQQPLGAFGQVCATPAPDTVCGTPTSIATSQQPGFTKCEKDFDCCLCQSVQCGNFIQGCTLFSSGNSGVYGVKDILIQGRQDGAQINCIGVEGCAESEIVATNIKDIDAAGFAALKNAKITVTDPLPAFSLNCVGLAACEGLQLEIIIPGPPHGFQCNPAAHRTIYFNKISCIDEESCKNMDLTVRNDGCNTIQIGMLECLQPNSCLGTNFNLIGDVEFNNCDLRGAATSSTTGIENCFANLERLICPDPTSCRDSTRTLVHPVNGFSMNCVGKGSCQNSVFTIEIDNTHPQGPVTYFDSFKFSGEGSGAGTTVIINNRQGIVLNIGRIECPSEESCTGTTFIIGKDVSVGEIICNIGTCVGCMIEIDAATRIPCDPNEIVPFYTTQPAVVSPGQGQYIPQGSGNGVGGEYIPI